MRVRSVAEKAGGRGSGRSGMRHSLGLDGVRHSGGLGALLGSVLVRIGFGFFLGIALGRVQPVKLVESIATCEFLDYGGIPHGYLSFSSGPEGIRGDAQHRI